MKTDTQFNLSDWYNQLPLYEKLEFAAATLDLAGLATSIPANSVANITGTALGSIGSITQFASDVNKDGLDWGDIKQLGISIGLDIGTALPVFGKLAEKHKLIKSLTKIYGVAGPLLSTLGYKDTYNTIGDVIKTGKITGDQARLITDTLLGIVGLKRAVIDPGRGLVNRVGMLSTIIGTKADRPDVTMIKNKFLGKDGQDNKELINYLRQFSILGPKITPLDIKYLQDHPEIYTYKKIGKDGIQHETAYTGIIRTDHQFWNFRENFDDKTSLGAGQNLLYWYKGPLRDLLKAGVTLPGKLIEGVKPHSGFLELLSDKYGMTDIDTLYFPNSYRTKSEYTPEGEKITIGSEKTNIFRLPHSYDRSNHRHTAYSDSGGYLADLQFVRDLKGIPYLLKYSNDLNHTDRGTMHYFSGIDLRTKNIKELISQIKNHSLHYFGLKFMEKHTRPFLSIAEEKRINSRNLELFMAEQKGIDEFLNDFGLKKSDLPNRRVWKLLVVTDDKKIINKTKENENELNTLDEIINGYIQESLESNYTHDPQIDYESDVFEIKLSSSSKKIKAAKQLIGNRSDAQLTELITELGLPKYNRKELIDAIESDPNLAKYIILNIIKNEKNPTRNIFIFRDFMKNRERELYPTKYIKQGGPINYLNLYGNRIIK